MNYYIGIDIGTSGTKSVLFDALGKVTAESFSEYNIISPNSLSAEENPLDWKKATLSTLSALSEAKIDGEIKGIGLSGQMHGLVILDKDDKPLRNSIIWCDNRTGDIVKMMEEKLTKADFLRITGNIPMGCFTLAKLLWVKVNEPDIYARIAKVMLPKDYIRYVLTGVFATEYSDASGMQMMDIEKRAFSKELLDLFEIDMKLLPELVESSSLTGYLREEIKEQTGLKDVFVVGGAGDQAALAIGNGIISSNTASIVLGSSGVVFSPTNELVRSINGEFQTFCHAIPNQYHIMGVTNGAGTSLKWFRDNLCQEELAIAQKENKDVYGLILGKASREPLPKKLFYLPYLMGERTPYLDNYASGVFFGLRNNTTKGDMIRAIIEGVSYSLYDCFSLIPNQLDNVFISGGGAKSSLWQTIIASMLNKELKTIVQTEGGALGAAILAMIGGNEYSSIKDAIERIITVKSVTNPVPELTRLYHEGYQVYHDLYQANKDLFQKADKLFKGEK